MIKDILGYFAGFTSTIFMIPQLYKIIVTKQVEDISITTIYIGFFSSSVWIAYGIVDFDIPIITCDVCMDIIYIIMYYYYRKYKKKRIEIKETINIQVEKEDDVNNAMGIEDMEIV
jgi:MtN3 and saliva related transmembrane protein